MEMTRRFESYLGLRLDTLACVALLVTALVILVSGAASVYQQNAQQVEQARQAQPRG